MTRPLVFMPAARLEAIEAQDWYEREAPGLGARFRTELDPQVEHILVREWGRIGWVVDPASAPAEEL